MTKSEREAIAEQAVEDMRDLAHLRGGGSWLKLGDGPRWDKPLSRRRVVMVMEGLLKGGMDPEEARCLVVDLMWDAVGECELNKKIRFIDRDKPVLPKPSLN